ncbi:MULTISPECIES: DUF6119 family protein [unclassified Streptomyces]|uniref:DUF6119 family protein n=1 Tax=unclassified Streptomyces TaxID=2593676 RepID=UPI00161135BC|nr:DUF6119 family protein [Streptomyces sp. I6]
MVGHLVREDLVEDPAEVVLVIRERQPGHPVGTDFTPRRIVYAVSLKSGKLLSTRNLFTFAQVSLLQAARALRAQGVEVAVVGIPTPETDT